MSSESSVIATGEAAHAVLLAEGTVLDVDETLRERFGLSAFRPWQREAVDQVLAERGRALVIAPTGGGKSLTYQLPAVVLGGTTVVISPLIALMEDQVRGLTERGIRATYLASTLDAAERREREQKLSRGEYNLVYVAPERLAYQGILDRLVALRPPLIAIDEAHCISQWGHDFRPDYMRLGEVLPAFGDTRVLACTATATPAVRDEILERLGMNDARVVMRGFARPNLHLSAVEVERAAGRRSAMLKAVTDALGSPTAPAGAAIVYAATRKNSEALASLVAAQGYRVAAYHAGLPSAERSEVNDAFAQRKLDVVVATNAFGMGIDRADIRCVVHAQAPGSIEAYYQEVGRAGRDGQPAHGLLISSASDIGLRRRLMERGRGGDDTSRAEIDRQWGLFKDLLRYIEAGSCRHDFILRYFGDEQETLGGCGHCDVCRRLEEEGDGERQVGEAESKLVRVALSAVARARRRAGLGAIADMLRGDTSAKVTRLGFTTLSTHGLMKEYPQEWILSLLRRLLTAGLVELTGGDFPMPYLTAAGTRVMRGDEPVRVLPPSTLRTKIRAARGESRASRSAPALALPAADAARFERLREVRLALAKEAGVPAYIICHDRVLAEIAKDKPASRHELAQVRGMGPARIEAYGDRLLQALTSA